MDNRPVRSIQHIDRFVIDDDDIDSNTATESDLSLNHGHSCTG